MEKVVFFAVSKWLPKCLVWSDQLFFLWEMIQKILFSSKSVIDYTVASHELFAEIEDFQILEFNRFMSDVHNPTTFNLTSRKRETKSSSHQQKVTKIKWEGSKNDAYLQNIDDRKVEELLGLLEKFKSSANTN